MLCGTLLYETIKQFNKKEIIKGNYRYINKSSLKGYIRS